MDMRLIFITNLAMSSMLAVLEVYEYVNIEMKSKIPCVYSKVKRV